MFHVTRKCAHSSQSSDGVSAGENRSTGGTRVSNPSMSSDNPSLSIQNDAILGLQEECDPSDNDEILGSMNKQLSNDTCPDGFYMLANLYCVHVTDDQLTYNEAFDYCNAQDGSELLYLDTNEDLIALYEDNMTGKCEINFNYHRF